MEIKIPKIITARCVISRETIEKLYTQDEISHMLHLSSQFFVKPEAHWFFCVFVFSAARESPTTLRLTTISTTVSRIHKYAISPGLLQVAPEITLDEAQSMWVSLVKAHFEAEDKLTYEKINRRGMSNYTRSFLDNGAGDLPKPPEFVIDDLDYEPGPKKPGPFLVR